MHIQVSGRIIQSKRLDWTPTTGVSKATKNMFFGLWQWSSEEALPALKVWDGILNSSVWCWSIIYGVPHSGTGSVFGEHGCMTLELKQVQGKPCKRVGVKKSALSKVGNLCPEQMVCWTRDRLPWDTLIWNKAKAAGLKAQIHTSRAQV